MCGTNCTVIANAHSIVVDLSDFRDLKTHRHKTAKFLIYEYVYYISFLFFFFSEDRMFEFSV